MHDELVDEVLARAERLAIYTLYVPDSRRIRGTPGAPDLFLCGFAAAEWWEIKTPNDVVRPAQRRWHYRLQGAGQRIWIYEPRDLDSGRIDRELRRIAGSLEI